ncbi:MAG TPA: hypothetical protein VF469_24305, partial [Kofleriaceae bacterium]
ARPAASGPTRCGGHRAGTRGAGSTGQVQVEAGNNRSVQLAGLIGVLAPTREHLRTTVMFTTKGTT